MYDQETLRAFIDTYGVVFNEKGETKACGRSTCKKLIQLAERLDPKGGSYGAHREGFIDIPKMTALYKMLKN